MEIMATAARLCAIVASTFFLRTKPEENSASPGIVIISTKAVATIIHAVSAALMLEVSASAGVANETIAAKAAGATNVAARHECAPMIFSPGFRSLLFDQTNPRVPDAV